MLDRLPPSEESLRAGYEVRDLSTALVVASALLLMGSGAILAILLWQVSLQVAPEQKADGVSPPVLMPGEPPVNDRIRAVPQPRLDSLEPLGAAPPT
jgi:hypothetical protein